MPSLKDYIKTLFKLSGSQAFPTNSRVQLTIPQSETWSQTYTASFDGYVHMWGADATYIELSNITTGIRSRTETSASAGLFMPVKKGDTFNCICKYTSTTDFRFDLVNSVGSS